MITDDAVKFITGIENIEVFLKANKPPAFAPVCDATLPAQGLIKSASPLRPSRQEGAGLSKSTYKKDPMNQSFPAF